MRPQHVEAAVVGDHADEILHELAEALLREHRRRGAARLVHVDQRAFEQAAEIGALIDDARERLHLLDRLVELALFVGLRIERGGVAVGEAAAGRCRRARGHDAVPLLG